MEDERCCGSGTCIINSEGSCWCGQQWNGSRMCFPDTAGDMNDSDNSVEGSGSPPVNSDSSPS